MRIEVLDKSRYREYEEFLLCNENSLFYHSTKYKDFLEDLLGCESRYLLAYENRKIVAALPLMIKDGPLGKVVNSLPYYGSNGSVISNNTIFHQALFDEYNRFIASSNIASATVIENPLSPLGTTPVHNMKDSRIGQLTSIGDYENYEDAVFKIIDGNRRNEIRRAQKHEVTVIEDNFQIDFIRSVHQNEMKKHNRKFKTDDFFCKIHKYFEPGEDFKIFIAYRENRPVAGLLMFYFNKTAEYFTPVVLEQERIHQPMSLILYHALLDAMKHNFKWFNWGGTWLNQDGVYQFKKKWGAKEIVYNYSTEIRNKTLLKADKSIFANEYEGFYIYNFEVNEVD